MKTTSLVLLILSLLVGNVLISASKGNGESGEQQSRRDHCDELVREPPPPTGQPSTASAPSTTASPQTSSSAPSSSDFHSKCTLVEALYNMSLTLSVQQQVVWNAWIQDMENSILANFSLTEDQKVVQVSMSMKAFFSINIDIYNSLSFVDIAGWGKVIDFMYVSINVQMEITQKVITLDGNDDCSLYDALRDAFSQQNCGCPSDQADVEAMIGQMDMTLKDFTYSSTQQKAVLSKLLNDFIKKHPQHEKRIRSKDIKDYGSMDSLLAVLKTHERSTTLANVVSGSSTADCVILQALQSASSNSSFTLSQQAQLLQLEQKLQVFFSANVSVAARIEYVSQSCYQMFVLQPWMKSIVKQVTLSDWGSVYDVIFCSGVCSNVGCDNPDNGPGPQQHDCSVTDNLITVNVTGNTTVLTNVLLTSYANFTNSQKLGFNSCFNKVRNAIWNNTAFPTMKAKYAELNTDFLQYNNNSVTNQQLVFNITISAWRGTVGQFVSCCRQNS